jgi:hypothetical protein
MEYYSVTQKYRQPRFLFADLLAEGQDWERLYSESPKSRRRYFTSPQFMRTWLSQWPGCITVYSSRLYRGKECVAVLFAAESKVKIGKIIPIKTLHLMRSGSDLTDQVWPEFIQPVSSLNDDELADACPEWFAEIMKCSGASQIIQHVTPKVALNPSFTKSKVSLLIENEENGSYCSLPIKSKLSSSTRRKISQTSRFFKAQGLHIKEIPPSSNYDIFIDTVSQWHQKKWENTSTPSGFSNPHFDNIIRELFLSQKGSECKRKMRAFALYSGEQIIGGTLLVEDGDWVGFYLAGYKDYNHNHVHLGIYMHHELMRVMREEGKNIYDFMAGDSMYKKSLSTHSQVHARGRWVKKWSLANIIYRFT